jgi:BCD family chlorophyll transporter-like MFS transporter
MIGLGAGLFAVSTLHAAMSLDTRGAGAGLALGAWGAAQATAAGLSIFFGGTIRDVVGHLATAGALGPALNDPSLGYSVVYHFEIGLLFATLVVLGPLVRVGILNVKKPTNSTEAQLRLAEFPT